MARLRHGAVLVPNVKCFHTRHGTDTVKARRGLCHKFCIVVGKLLYVHIVGDSHVLDMSVWYALSALLGVTSASGYQLVASASEARQKKDTVITNIQVCLNNIICS